MTQTLLVTGATGTLGRRVVAAAGAAGYHVRGLSRRDPADHSTAFPTAVRWYRGDLLGGTGIDAAVENVEVLVHCATQFIRAKDVAATQHLIDAARAAGVGNLIYVSIVGVDRIPVPYYKTKWRVEQQLAQSGLAHTIQRVTQFHELIDTMFSIQRFSPLLLALRAVRFQPIDPRDVAAHLLTLIDAGPMGRADDIGGPEVREHADLARAYLGSRNSRRRAVGVAVPGRIVAGYRSGANLAPDHPVGTITFADYLVESR